MVGAVSGTGKIWRWAANADIGTPADVRPLCQIPLIILLRQCGIAIDQPSTGITKRGGERLAIGRKPIGALGGKVGRDITIVESFVRYRTTAGDALLFLGWDRPLLWRGRLWLIKLKLTVKHLIIRRQLKAQ